LRRYSLSCCFRHTPNRAGRSTPAGGLALAYSLDALGGPLATTGAPLAHAVVALRHCVYRHHRYTPATGAGTRGPPRAAADVGLREIARSAGVRPQPGRRLCPRCPYSHCPDDSGLTPRDGASMLGQRRRRTLVVTAIVRAISNLLRPQRCSCTGVRYREVGTRGGRLGRCFYVKA